MATYPVKFINESMRGAPALGRNAGTMVATLDAFLLDGWGATTPTSITVVDGVATATLAAGQTFETHAIIKISGATPAALNGEARVLSSSSTTITFATDAPNGTASGTIEIRYAPVGGWKVAFSSGNKRAYRSDDPAASGFYFRIDDTTINTCRIVGYESMSDIDTGTAAFPTEAQAPGGGSLAKTSASGSNQLKYEFFADSAMVLLNTAFASVSNAASVSSSTFGFGDFVASKPGGTDAWAVGVACAGDVVVNGVNYDKNGALDGNENMYNTKPGIYFARSALGIGSAVRVTSTIPYSGSSANGIVSGADATFGVGPSTVSGIVYLSRRFVPDAASASTPRADVPGLLHIPQSGLVAAVGNRDVLDGAGEFSGRKLRAVARTSGLASGSPNGIGLIDMTGPWR